MLAHVLAHGLKGGVIDKDEEQVTEALNLSIRKAAGEPLPCYLSRYRLIYDAALCPDPHRALDDLLAFAKLNEGRLFKLLHTCMDPQTDLKNLVKATVCTQLSIVLLARFC